MIIKHCVQCGEILEQNDETCYQCPYGHEFFNNPHSGVSILFMQNGKILLTKRGIEPFKGMYGFVGGFINFNEDPRHAAQREVKEETGVDLLDMELTDVRTQMYRNNESAVSIIFVAKEWRGEFKAGDDAAKLVWKPLEFIESDQVAWHYPGLLAKLQSIADNT